jgi:hypothetical protein
MTIATVSATATPYVGYYCAAAPPIAPVPGQPLVVSGWIRSSEARTFIGTLVAHDEACGGWSVVNDEQRVSVDLQPNVWTRLVVTVPQWPDSASQRLLRVVFEPTGANKFNWSGNDTIDASALMVTQGSTLYNYADGNSPGWSWTGTPNASTSFGPAL